jgi:hypothetical protein
MRSRRSSRGTTFLRTGVIVCAERSLGVPTRSLRFAMRGPKTIARHKDSEVRYRPKAEQGDEVRHGPWALRRIDGANGLGS